MLYGFYTFIGIMFAGMFLGNPIAETFCGPNQCNVGPHLTALAIIAGIIVGVYQEYKLHKPDVQTTIQSDSVRPRNYQR